MVRRPARVKASPRLSVKPLDAANGMMDRSADNVDNVDIFGGNFLIFSRQCWSAVGNGACGSGGETTPPSPTGPTGAKRKSYIQASFRVCRDPKRNTIFPPFTTVFTLHRQSSISGKRNTSPLCVAQIESKPQARQ